MDGVVWISQKGRFVRKFHHSSQFLAERPGRYIRAHPRFEQSGNLSLQVADLYPDARFLHFSDPRFPAKREHVNVHSGKTSLSPDFSNSGAATELRVPHPSRSCEGWVPRISTRCPIGFRSTQVE